MGIAKVRAKRITAKQRVARVKNIAIARKYKKKLSAGSKRKKVYSKIDKLNDKIRSFDRIAEHPKTGVKMSNIFRSKAYRYRQATKKLYRIKII